MGIFDKLFDKGEKEKTESAGSEENWIRSEEDWQHLLRRSHERPIAFFKHSTRCGISSMAMKRLLAEWDLDPSQVELHFLDLLSYRAISDKAAENLDVRHASPQIILLWQGNAVYDTSHAEISAEGIRSALENLEG